MSGESTSKRRRRHHNEDNDDEDYVTHTADTSTLENLADLPLVETMLLLSEEERQALCQTSKRFSRLCAGPAIYKRLVDEQYTADLVGDDDDNPVDLTAYESKEAVVGGTRHAQYTDGSWARYYRALSYSIQLLEAIIAYLKLPAEVHTQMLAIFYSTTGDEQTGDSPIEIYSRQRALDMRTRYSGSEFKKRFIGTGNFTWTRYTPLLVADHTEEYLKSWDMRGASMVATHPRMPLKIFRTFVQRGGPLDRIPLFVMRKRRDILESCMVKNIESGRLEFVIFLEDEYQLYSKPIIGHPGQVHELAAIYQKIAIGKAGQNQDVLRFLIEVDERELRANRRNLVARVHYTRWVAFSRSVQEAPGVQTLKDFFRTHDFLVDFEPVAPPVVQRTTHTFGPSTFS